MSLKSGILPPKAVELATMGLVHKNSTKKWFYKNRCFISDSFQYKYLGKSISVGLINGEYGNCWLWCEQSQCEQDHCNQNQCEQVYFNQFQCKQSL